MKNLDDILGSNACEVSESQQEKLKLTTYALAKAWLYARIACRVAEGTMECGGYLVCPSKANDGIATDAILAKDQVVEEGHYLVRAWQVRQAGQEISRAGYKVLGWWHSHGHLHSFFSALDDEGQKAVLNAISGVNTKTRLVTRNINLSLSNGLYSDDADNRRTVQFQSDDRVMIPTPHLSMRISEPRTISLAYGLVVNALNDQLYAEVSCRELSPCCRNITDTTYEASLEYFRLRPQKISTAQLELEIRKYVRMPPKKTWFASILPFGEDKPETFPLKPTSQGPSPYKFWAPPNDTKATPATAPNPTLPEQSSVTMSPQTEGKPSELAHEKKEQDRHEQIPPPAAN